MKQAKPLWLPSLTLLIMGSTTWGGITQQGIKWYEGSLDQAFEQAVNQKKPVLLYWGAKWCPPCNQLKAAVFKSPSFIEKIRLFIPVYLDGDTERAQKYGEAFQVMGYPTLILFTPDRVADRIISRSTSLCLAQNTPEHCKQLDQHLE